VFGRARGREAANVRREKDIYISGIPAVTEIINNSINSFVKESSSFNTTT
jgi:hypothetical protein